jgi:hypothetical protein
MTTVEQVIERARAMVRRTQSIVLLDASPAPLAALVEDLADAVGRGVRVALQAYAPFNLPSALILDREENPANLSLWPGQQLSLVADAREHVLALLSRDGKAVQQAIWSRSTFLSCMQHNHVACELIVVALDHLPEGDPRREQARSLSLLRSTPPGLTELSSRFS